MSDTKTSSGRRQTPRSGSTTEEDSPLTKSSLPPAVPGARPVPRPNPGSRRPQREPSPDDAVTQLAGALRTAERAHHAYLAELRLADVEPAEDWSLWYAEYLVGLR